MTQDYGDYADCAVYRSDWERGDVQCSGCELPLDSRRDVQTVTSVKAGTRPGILLVRHSCGKRIRMILLDFVN